VAAAAPFAVPRVPKPRRREGFQAPILPFERAGGPAWRSALALALDPAAPTPAVVFSVGGAAAAWRALRAAMPGVALHYAAKANPAPEVLRALRAEGAAFDAASLPEIEACLAAGASPGSVCFGATAKRFADVARARDLGVGLFAFDSEEELRKIAAAAGPGAGVYARIAVPDGGGGAAAAWPLGRKFGCPEAEASRLLALAAGIGLRPEGVSFHVGSQQADPGAWRAPIAAAAQVFRDLRAGAGIALRLLNVGGGFPARGYLRRPGEPAPPPAPSFGAAILDAVRESFAGLPPPRLMAEPGRAAVADAGVLVAEVILASRRDPSAPGGGPRWVYLDAGRFGGLAEAEGEAIALRAVPALPRPPGAPEGPAVLAGPSCDSADTLWERSGHALPLDLRAGERLLFPGAGAYVAAYGGARFNGFPSPREVFVP